MAAAFASASAAESSAVRMIGSNALTMASANTSNAPRKSKKRSLDDDYSDEMAFPDSRCQAKRATGSDLQMSSHVGGASSAASQLHGFAFGSSRKRDTSWRDADSATFDENAKRNRLVQCITQQTPQDSHLVLLLRSTSWQAAAPQMVTVNKHQLELHEGQYKAEIERLKYVD